MKLKRNDGKENDNNVKLILPNPLAAFVLKNTERFVNNFVRQINGFLKDNVCYSDTDSLYIEKNCWDVLDKAGLVDEDLSQGKTDYISGGILYLLFLAPKIKYCLTIDQHRTFQEPKTFKRFTDPERIIKRKQYFERMIGNKISKVIPFSWKKGILVRELLFIKKRDILKNAKKCI